MNIPCVYVRYAPYTIALWQNTNGKSIVHIECRIWFVDSAGRKRIKWKIRETADRTLNEEELMVKLARVILLIARETNAERGRRERPKDNNALSLCAF